MKFCSLLITIFLCTQSSTVFANWVKESDLKAPKTMWMKKAKCEVDLPKDEEGQLLEYCYNITGKDMRKFMLGQIDNPDSIKYGKQDRLPCTDLEDDCQTLYSELDCSSYAEGSYPVNREDVREVYCAVPIGFNKMPGLVVDVDGKKAAEDAEELKESDAASRIGKIGPRFNALKSCLSNSDALTDPQLRTCMKRLIREVLSRRLQLSDL